jgi:hypothetical protein
MDYFKIYNRIICRAKLEKRKKLNRIDINYIYYESHHIIPRCMGGSNEEANLVLLTAREHFLCHWLLYESNKKNTKLALAFFMMCNVKDKNQIRYTPSSKIIEYAKIQHSLYHHSKLDKFKKINSDLRKGKSLEVQLGKEKALSCSIKKSNSLKECYLNNPHLLKRKSESMKGKNKVPKRFTCPNCGKIGGISTMKQKHLPKCLANTTNS